MTTGTDTFTGGAGNDTFNAAILTMTSGDSVTGGAGTDTFNVTTNAGIAATNTISGVEVLNVTAYGAQSLNLNGATGIQEINTVNSTGALTITNLKSNAKLGFAGSTNNTITATYDSSVLAGASDTASMTMNGASAVAATVNAGFESLSVALTGTNTVTTLSAPSVTTLTLTGTGSLEAAANALDSYTTINATNTGALTLGTVTGVNTLLATSTSSVAAKNINATTGFATDVITGSATGLTLMTGAGADNISITTAATSGSNTVDLGAGNDKVVLNLADARSATIFTGEGDDAARIITTAAATTDVFNMGAGTDTLTVAVAGANALTLQGVENLNLTSTATGAITVTSADSALAVTANVNGSAVNLIDLTAGSTVKTQTETGAATTTAGAVSVGFKAVEAANTVNISTGMTGILTLDNITAATVTLGAASNMANNAIVLTSDITSLTVNATGAFTTGTGDISSVDNKLATLAITGSAAVTVDDIFTSALTSVTATAAGALSMGAVVNGDNGSGASSGTANTKLSTVSYTATGLTGAITADTIGATTVTNLSSVTMNAATAVIAGTIDGAKVGDVTITATNGALAVEQITAQTTMGTVTLTSTNGAINGNAAAVTAADNTGITVGMTAKTFISANGTSIAAGQNIVVQNTGGNITATLDGAAAANVDYKAVTSGKVTLTATNTGGLTSTITNAGTAGDAGTSTIVLGNAISGATNAITIDGVSDTVNVTGGTGADTIAFSDTVGDKVKGGTFTLGAGADTVDFSLLDLSAAGATDTSSDNGLVINLGSTTVTFDSTQAYESTVLSGKVVEYDATGDENSTVNTSTKVVSGGESFTLSGVDNVIGTAGVDYIVAAGTGSTIAGGVGADTIILGGGADTVVLTTGGAIAVDVVSNFGSTDVVQVDLSDINAIVTDLSLAGTTSSNLAADTAPTVQIITGAYNFDSATTADLIAVSSATAFTTSTLQTALETGGADALTFNGALSAGDAILVVWDDNVDTYISYVTSTAGVADNALAGSGDLTVTNIVKLSGIADASTAILTGNIDIIA